MTARPDYAQALQATRLLELLQAYDPHVAGTPPLGVDLPAGGRRLMQTATGYHHTFKRGVETFANGEHTGALPGRLVRGPQPAPR